MNNNIQKNETQIIQPTQQATSINLPGDGNTLIAHAENVKNEYNSNIVVIANRQNNSALNQTVDIQDYNSNYYNLIVVGEDDLATDNFLIRKDRALTENTTPEIKSLCASLSDDAIARLKSFPALIASENHKYGRTDEEHIAIYGIILDIRVQDNGIKIYYRLLNYVPQQKLNDLAFELGIVGTSSFNELNRMHWAVKKIDLVSVLREAGIKIFAFN